MKKALAFLCAVAVIALVLPLPAQAEEMESPLYLKIGRGDMTLVGYTQLSYRFFQDDDTVGRGGSVFPANEDDEFFWDRIRLIIRGHIVPQIYYKFQWELAGTSGNKLRDGMLQFHLYPALDFNLTVGQWKIPFTEAGLLWVTTKDEFVRGPMIYESFVGTPVRVRDREFGAMFSAKLLDKRVYAFTGFFNGTGYDQSDENDQKDWLAGVRITPFPAKVATGRQYIGSLLEGFQIGAAYMSGTAGEMGEQTSRDRASVTVLYYRTLSPVDKIRLRAEYIYQKLDEHETLALFGAPEVQTTDFYIMGAYRHDKIEFAVRYDMLDNEDQEPTYGTKDAVTLALNYYLNKFTRIRFNYGLYDEEDNSFSNNEGIVQLELAF